MIFSFLFVCFVTRIVKKGLLTIFVEVSAPKQNTTTEYENQKKKKKKSFIVIFITKTIKKLKKKKKKKNRAYWQRKTYLRVCWRWPIRSTINWTPMSTQADQYGTLFFCGQLAIENNLRLSNIFFLNINQKEKKKDDQTALLWWSISNALISKMTFSTLLTKQTKKKKKR